MRKLLPLIMALIGLGLGGGAGYVLHPAAHDADAPEGNQPSTAVIQPDYVKLNNQFIVPVVDGGRVASMVVLSLSLEVAPGETEMKLYPVTPAKPPEPKK